MSIMRKKKLWALVIACGAGTVFQYYLPKGCIDYFVSGAVSAFDFCSVLNCSGSSFFNFCSTTPPLLVDCPPVATTT